MMAMVGRLVTIQGPWKGVELALERRDQVLGRDPGCDLPVADTALSRRHFRLVPHGDGWAVEDLGSRNGTWVTGERVERRTLRNGDTIQAGRSLFRFDEEPVEGLMGGQTEEASVLAVGHASAAGTGRDPLSPLLELADSLAHAEDRATFGACFARWLLARIGGSEAVLCRRTSGRLEAEAGYTPGGSCPPRSIVLPFAAAADASREGKAVLVVEKRKSGRSLVVVPIGSPAELVVAVTLAATAPDADELRLLACAGHLAAGFLASQARVELASPTTDPANTAGPPLLGASPAMRAVLAFVELAAPTDATVLLLGESGSGKEVVARAIHGASRRQGGPFVAVNCAAIPETLVESELFGHERGAFTSASARRAGRFEQASGGTLLLDEVGDLSPQAQAGLLRVLEERAVVRLGGADPVAIDTRIVAATHRDLKAEVDGGRFREDLYFRLSVLVQRVPPLSERPEDIEPLAHHFLRLFAGQAARRIDGFSPAALAALKRYSWPGNVRELRNAVERAVILGQTASIQPRDLAAEVIAAQAPDGAAETVILPAALAELERKAIYAALRATSGNKTEAAKILGIDRVTLYHRLKGYAKDPAR